MRKVYVAAVGVVWIGVGSLGWRSFIIAFARDNEPEARWWLREQKRFEQSCSRSNRI